MRAIVCVDKNFGIGKDGKLLYNIKRDLSRFKSLTSDGIVIMGRGTMESLPKGKLPNRKNVVITHREIDSEDSDIEYSNSIDEVLQKYSDRNDVYIIGGESIYNQFLPYCSFVSLTMVKDEREADCYFPNIINDNEWEKIFQSQTFHDDNEDVDFYFVDFSHIPKKLPKAE